jgi:hypothetical protein
VPDAVGLAEITGLPDGVALPDIGTAVTGEVIWHAEHNHQASLFVRLYATSSAMS